VKTKRTRPTKSPWITTNLKKRMNFRNGLKKKAVKTKDASSWNRFRKVKNKVNQEIKATKKAYYNNSFNNYAGDQRKTWKTINELTSRKSNKTIINEIQYQGLKSSNQAEVAELLNTFFIEIGPRLSRNVSNLKHQRQVSTAIMMYKTVHGMTPDYLTSKFVSRDEITSYRLRNTENKLVLPLPRTNYLEKSFSYSGAKLWNSLSHDLRSADSLHDFKRKLCRNSFE
ncbi:unnamed protein product, partial [Porites lobata]